MPSVSGARAGSRTRCHWEIVRGVACRARAGARPEDRTRRCSVIHHWASSDACSAPAVTATAPAPAAKPAAGGAVKSPLPGVVLDIQVAVGDRVGTGQRLMILEAMKMENNIDSDREGTVKEIKVATGDSVLEGDVLLTIE